jgi:branched-chain amino acid transport system substrate-binding protein
MFCYTIAPVPPGFARWPWEQQGGETLKTYFFSKRMRSISTAIVFAAALSLVLAACGGSGSKSSNSGSVVDNPKCGNGDGTKPTGTPIKIGAIATKQPGTDFTDGTAAADAYFNCVNDNGGVNGHPIQYIAETEQTDPAQDAALAKKLIESDGVLGMTGGFSLIECDVNHSYYEQKGIAVMNAGIAPSCWASPNSAPVNMGPRYSSDGAVQAMIRQDVDKIVFDQSNVPGTGYIAAGPKIVADAAGIPITEVTDNVPIQDANSVAVKLTQQAGSNGAVVLNFTPPEALKILQAAQQQGLEDSVKAWACSTPCNTDFLADALGTKWDGKLLVNAELNVTDYDGPDSELYRSVMKKYGQNVTGGLGSFSQMGYLMGEFMTNALETVQGDYTVKSVNDAVFGLKAQKTDILCNPWYYGKAPLHIPNNVDRTTTPDNGHMVQKEDCFEISADEPDIAKVREIQKADPSLVGEG